MFAADAVRCMRRGDGGGIPTPNVFWGMDSVPIVDSIGAMPNSTSHGTPSITTGVIGNAVDFNGPESVT